jgi:hypothetical protein
MRARVNIGRQALSTGPSSGCRLRAIDGSSAPRAIRPGASHEQTLLAVRPSFHSAQAVRHEQ